MERKQAIFSSCFKPDVSLQNQAFPISSNMFTDETQSIISLISQFLGLDTNSYVIDSLMSLLFKVSTGQIECVESAQSCCLKFDEFLAENMHSQLVNFQSTSFFRYQSYMVNMFLFFNEENFQFLELVLTDEMSKNFRKYMNFLMSEIYQTFFQQSFPKVIPLMKEILQFP